MRRYLVEGIVTAAFILPGLLRGKSKIWVSQIGRWRCAAPFSLLGASFLEQLVGGGYVVERLVSSRVNNGGPRRCGAVESQRRTHAEVRAQGGGTA
jgi:hypothetical protein